MWVRFGFSDKIFDDEKIPSSKLRFTLAQLQSEKYREKLKELQVRTKVLQKICKR